MTGGMLNKKLQSHNWPSKGQGSVMHPDRLSRGFSAQCWGGVAELAQAHHDLPCSFNTKNAKSLSNESCTALIYCVPALVLPCKHKKYRKRRRRRKKKRKKRKIMNNCSMHRPRCRYDGQGACMAIVSSNDAYRGRGTDVKAALSA
eukprot:1140108-Pelagomonas_calceolata.AAC.6